MKVHELISLLRKYNGEAEVVINRDVDNYGFGTIDKVKTGLFQLTDYGNDFLPDQKLIIFPKEVEAICLYPVDYDKNLSIEIKLEQ